VLSDAEVVKVWGASTSEEGPFGAAVRLLLLTGARREEICQLRWSEIDGDTIRLDGVRTKSGKPHTIALSAPARALLEDMPKIGEYVFSFGGSKPLNVSSRNKTRLDRAAGIKAWRLHDLRRTVATGLQKLGVRLEVTETVLGHTGGSRAGIVGVYQRHAFTDEARAALEAWEAHVVGLVEGRAPAKVLPMRRGA
jgi:integrase